MLSLIGLFVISLAAYASNDGELDAIWTSAKAVNDAGVAGNFAVVIDSMPEEVIRAAGGKAQYLTIVKTQMEQVKAQGWEIQKVITQRPQQVFAAGGNRFALVHCLHFYRVPQGYVRQETDLLAASAGNSGKWNFVFAQAFPDAWVRKLYPAGLGGLFIPPKKDLELFVSQPAFQ